MNRHLSAKSLLPLALTAATACGPDNPVNNIDPNIDRFEAYPVSTNIIADGVRNDAVHIVDGNNGHNNDIATPGPLVGEISDPTDVSTPRLYNRPTSMPDGADVYFFPQAYEGGFPYNESDRNVVGQIPRSRHFEIGAYYLEAPNKDLTMDAKWDFVLNWYDRHGGLPPLTEEAIASTRFYLMSTLGDIECDVILEEGEFRYLPAGDAYYAQVDCGEIEVPANGENQAHRMSLVGDFSNVDDEGNRHYGLGGLFTRVTPQPIFNTLDSSDDLEEVVVNQTSAGRLASGTVVFYETPQNTLSVVTKYPHGTGGLVGETIHGTKGFWGVVEGDPVFVSQADTILTGGQRVYDDYGIELRRTEWTPEQLRAIYQYHTLAIGTENTNYTDRLLPGEVNTSTHRAILNPQECIDAEVCHAGRLYRNLEENDLGGPDCEMPDEVCDIAPAAYTAGISTYVLPDYESTPFFDPLHPSFGTAYFDLSLLSMTSDAESIEVVSLDGTRFVVPATIADNNEKTFHFDMAARIPSIVADMDVEFGVCFSAEVDPAAGEIITTFCSCEDVVFTPDGYYNCPPETEE
jgi:hypothetical protein